MKARFEITETLQAWGPPFDKKTQLKTFIAGENEHFDEHGKNKQPVFAVLKITGDRALVEYHREFTLKGYQQPQNKQLWMEKNQAFELSHLWGDHGLTKKIEFKGMDIGSSTAASASAESTSH